jgi:hypothetical protein
MVVVVRRSRRNDSGVMRGGGLRRIGESRTNQNERQHPFAPCGDMPIPNNRQIVHRGGAWEHGVEQGMEGTEAKEKPVSHVDGG